MSREASLKDDLPNKNISSLKTQLYEVYIYTQTEFVRLFSVFIKYIFISYICICSYVSLCIHIMYIYIQIHIYNYLYYIYMYPRNCS